MKTRTKLERWRLHQLNKPARPVDTWQYILYDMPKGGARRQKILDKLVPSETEDGMLSVNRKYCCIVNRDTDLQHLLKTGKVYLVNVVETKGGFVNKYSTKRTCTSRNYIVLSEYFTKVGIRKGETNGCSEY